MHPLRTCLPDIYNQEPEKTKKTTRLSIQDCVQQNPMPVTIILNFTPLSFLPLNWHKINFGFYYTTNVMYMSCTLHMYMNYYEIKTNSFQFAKHLLVAASKMLYETIAISLFACLLKPTLLAGHGFTYHACMLPTQCSLLLCSSLRSLRRIFKQKRDDSLSLTNPKCEAD